MLTRFEIKGFKSLVNVGVDLGAVNVFIGANGCGKTNLLEALGFLGAVAFSSLEYEGYRFRGIRPGDPDSFICQFPNNPKLGIKFQATLDGSSYALEIQKVASNQWEITQENLFFDQQQLFERDRRTFRFFEPNKLTSRSFKVPDMSKSIVRVVQVLFEMFLSSNTVAGIAQNNAAWWTLLNDLEHFAIFSPSTPQLRGEVNDVKHDPIGLGGSELARAIEEMVQADPGKLGPFWLDDVTELIEWMETLGTNSVGRSSDAPVRMRLGDRFMRDERNALTTEEVSEGSLYVLFMLALVGHPRSPRLFGIDNFDQALHPRLARELTRAVCNVLVEDGTRQMLATTHNPLVLDGLDLLDDRIRLFAVDRDPTGATQVKRVTVTPEIMKQAESGMSLSRLWTMGRLGGVPHNF